MLIVALGANAMPSEDLLTSAEQMQLSARADAFHSALRKGAVGADWNEHLEDLEGPVRIAVLIELAILDMGHRWQKGERVGVEEYVRRFPELGPPDAISPKLITEEFRSRVASGDNPNLSQFQSRFPVQFSAIRSQLLAMSPQESPAAKTPAQGTAVGGVAGEFEFIRKLGQGVFGEVWLAKKKTSGIEKAIKILLQAADHEAAIRELRSLELIKNLRHPYLLATEDFWISGDRLHVVMELAEGTLRNRLKDCQTDGLPGIPEPELFRFFTEAAEGLDYLHEQKITHRDVKPDNILFLRGHAKVADFGLARMQDQIMSQMSVFAGTPAYMAPEVWGGEGGPASDQYSLAATYVELRQGKTALKLGPLPEMMIAHLDGIFHFADFIPDAEQDVLRRAMAKNPEDRYQNCNFFMEALAMASNRSISRFALSPGKSSGGMAALTRIGAKERSGPIPVSGARTWGAAKAELDEHAPSRETRIPASTGVQPRFAPKPLPVPGKPKPKPAGIPKVALAGFLVVGLIAVIAFAVFLFSGNGTPPTTGASATEPTTEPTTAPTKNDPTPTTKVIPETKISCPGSAKPEENSPVIDLVDGRKAHQWVTIAAGAETLRFRLIPGGTRGDVKPFYLSEFKVWVGLYRAAGSGPIRETDAKKPADAGEPLMNVTAGEALAFAKKIAPGEGSLPTPDQWDHAAGLYRAATLSSAGASPVVGVAQPTATRLKPTDSNDLGLKDMTGNGREWTRGVFVAKGQPLKLATEFTAEDRVVLRGRNYTLPTPLTIEKLKYDQTDPQAAFAGKPSPYTGFRIVLPVP